MGDWKEGGCSGLVVLVAMLVVLEKNLKIRPAEKEMAAMSAAGLSIPVEILA
jgi:hypothetical protein